MTIDFVKYKNFFIFFSVISVVISLVLVFYLRPEFGIDLEGGSQFEIQLLTPAASAEEVNQLLTKPEFAGFHLGDILVRQVGNQEFLIRSEKITPTTHIGVIEEIRRQKINGQAITLEARELVSISPIIGAEMQRDSVIVIIVALLAMLIYITFAFYKLKKPVKNWKYAIITIFTLFHDIVVTLGIIVIINYFYGLEITIPIIVALLTILGYSVNDTVVIFDRIRENLLQVEANIEKKKKGREFLDTESTFPFVVNKSLNQVVARSLATSITTLLVLFALFFLGGEIVRNFALVLIIGIILGTYSSFFIASPWLIVLGGKKKKKIQPVVTRK
jgi:preprotein translocase subunit SecF